MNSWFGEIIGYIFLAIFAFGWIDTLWIFGVENSKEYTWWFLIQQLGEYFNA
jgi:nitrate reductase gamma subunit